MAIHKIQELALNFSLPCRKFYSLLISLCWQQSKLACDLAWPQIEIFMRTNLFLLWDITVWSEKQKVQSFPWCFGTMCVVSAASHECTSKCKWKLEIKKKKKISQLQKLSQASRKGLIKVKHLFCYLFYLVYFLLSACEQWTHGCGQKVLLLKFLAKPSCCAEADRLLGKVTMLTSGGRFLRLEGKGERANRNLIFLIQNYIFPFNYSRKCSEGFVFIPIQNKNQF